MNPYPQKKLNHGFIQHLNSRKNLGAGFTLVEMIVAIGLFTVVMFVATGALLSVVSLNKKAQAQQSAINNLNYALENMARSIRTGTTYHCGDTGNFDATLDCPLGSDTLAYESDGTDNTSGVTNDPTNPTDQRVFKLDTSRGVLRKSKDSGATWLDVTDPSIIIQNLTFVVTGTAKKIASDNKQPQVRINIAGYAFVNENTASPRPVNFSLQTLASQRQLDN